MNYTLNWDVTGVFVAHQPNKGVDMKKLAQVTEVVDEGLISLLGKQVTIFCLNYIYHGELEGVNDTCIKLKEPKIVYSTGCFSDTGYSDAQSICSDSFYIQMGCIESFGELSNKND
jgi:hypothetical protein